jgi:hypothetical protein
MHDQHRLMCVVAQVGAITSAADATIPRTALAAATRTNSHEASESHWRVFILVDFITRA